MFILDDITNNDNKKTIKEFFFFSFLWFICIPITSPSLLPPFGGYTTSLQYTPSKQREKEVWIGWLSLVIVVSGNVWYSRVP
jgi:hypothetical protein